MDQLSPIYYILMMLCSLMIGRILMLWIYLIFFIAFTWHRDWNSTIKSKVFGPRVLNKDILTLSYLLKCKVASPPFSYIGLPVWANMNMIKSWKLAVEKIKRKIRALKGRNLYFSGRLTLLTSVLSNLPLYYFSLYKSVFTVIENLEKIRSQYF